MRFTPVEKLPEKASRNPTIRSEYKPIRTYLESFMKMGVKYAKVEIDYWDYSSEQICQKSLARAAKSQGFPIDVVFRYGEIYLVRRDI